MTFQNFFFFYSRLGSRFALALIVLLHLALVIPLSLILNVWVDEAYTLQSTGGGLAHSISRSLNFELQPPLYYVILASWRTLDSSIFFARFFSIICTASTVALSGCLARRYFIDVPSTLLAVLIAFNPITVYAAVEIRGYAIALLISAILLILFYDGYSALSPSPAARRCHAAVAAAGLYTHYFLGFLLVAGAPCLLLLGRRRALRKYLINMLIVAASFAPLVVVTGEHMLKVEASGVRPQTLVDGIRLVWNSIWQYLLPVTQDSLLSVVCRWVSRLSLPIAFLAACIRRRSPSTHIIIPIIIAIVVSLFFLVVAMRFGPDFMLSRHTIALYLPVVLAILVLLRCFGGFRASVCGVIVSLLFYVPYLMETYTPLAKMGDWIRVSRYIEQHEAFFEPILVFKADFVHDFGYHYKGKNRLIPIPKPTSTERYNLKEQLLQDESEIISALQGKLGVGNQFWLVTSGTSVSTQIQSFRGVDFHPEILENFVTHHCIVLRNESFFKTRVRLLLLKPGAALVFLGTNLR